MFNLLNEIQKLRQHIYTGGKKDLDVIKKYNKVLIKKAKPYPGYPDLIYTFNNKLLNTDFESGFYIFDINTKELIAYLHIIKNKIFPISPTIIITRVTVDENYRNRGIATSIYKLLLCDYNYTITTDYQQTPAGRKLWVSLSKMPNIEVLGYFSIDDLNLDDDHIDIIMGKVGAQYLGNVRDEHVFSFDVKSDELDKEMVSLVKTKLTKIYSIEYDDIAVGMFARCINYR